MVEHEPGEPLLPGPTEGDGDPRDGNPAGLMDLRSSLLSLSNLSTGQLSLDEMLTQVATFAVRAIPGPTAQA